MKQRAHDHRAFVDNDLDGLDDQFEQELAEKFAPVLIMGPREPNYPIRVEWLLERTHLAYRRGPGRHLVAREFVGTQEGLLRAPASMLHDRGGLEALPSPVAGTPECLGPARGWYLTDVPAHLRTGSLDARDWVTYVHVYPTATGGVIVQYWHLFAYNYQPLSRHGGDWDACVHVQLDARRLLLGAWFSRHHDDHPGSFIPARDLELWRAHPVVAIDEGGHAAFASPDDWGRHPGAPLHLPGSAIVWPTDPTDPGTLSNAFPTGRPLLIRPRRGGTIWQTWTGGEVRQAGRTTYPLQCNPSGHGGLINVGEYAVGDHHGGPFPTGTPRPLNNQLFIAYSGFWGRPHPVWHSPRGPVFQGFHQGWYRAWYNQAAPQRIGDDG